MQLPKAEMTVFEAILARRSVRSYSARDVGRATVQTLLEAAVRAPTAMHREPWAFIVIQDRQLLRRLSDIARPLFAEEIRRAGLQLDAFSSPDFNVFYDAGTLIVIGSVANGAPVAADCWLAAENLMLAARAMELGSCVIGAALSALNTPEVKTGFGIPANFSAVAPIVVGYPANETAPTARKKPFILALENS